MKPKVQVARRSRVETHILAISINSSCSFTSLSLSIFAAATTKLMSQAVALMSSSSSSSIRSFRFITHGAAAKKNKPNPKQKQKQKHDKVGFTGERKETSWGCVQGCGACCKLVKGPSFAKPEEIFEDPSDIQLYNSLIGPDDWCIHYDKPTRSCSIYSDRPYFCRVEPDIFKTLYGIEPNKFHKEACSCCRDTIKAIYGPRSQELDKFNQNLKNLSSIEA